jgi:hypothetical protein
MIEVTERQTMSVRSAAKIIGISHVSLFKAINNGTFKAYIRIGHRVFVPKVALEKYLENAGSQP